MIGSKLLRSVAFAGVLLGSGCTEDPEAAANEIFVAASAKWAEYQALSTEDTAVLEQRLNLLTEIDTSLQKIVSDYPSSTLAVELASSGKVKQIPWTENKSLMEDLAEDLTCAKDPNSEVCVFPNLRKRMEQVDLGRAEADVDILFALGGETKALIERAEAVEDPRNRSNQLLGLAVFSALVGNADDAREAFEKSGTDPSDRKLARTGIPALIGTAYLLDGSDATDPNDALAALDAAKKSQADFFGIADATRPAVYNLARWSILEAEAGRVDVAKSTMESLLRIMNIKSEDYFSVFGPQVAAKVLAALSKTGMTTEAQSILDRLLARNFYGKEKLSEIGTALDVGSIPTGITIEWLPEVLSLPEAKAICTTLSEDLTKWYAFNPRDRSYVSDALVARVAFACGDAETAQSTLATAWNDYALSGKFDSIEAGAYIVGTLQKIQDPEKAMARLAELKGLAVKRAPEKIPYWIVQKLASADAATMGLEFATAGEKDGSITGLTASSVASVALRLASDGKLREAREAARLSARLLLTTKSDKDFGESSRLFGPNNSDLLQAAFPSMQRF